MIHTEVSHWPSAIWTTLLIIRADATTKIVTVAVIDLLAAPGATIIHTDSRHAIGFASRAFQNSTP